jgi:phosphoglycolate phosphatase
MPGRLCASAVIFDLDGTLVQTRGASWDVFRKISDEFGLGLTGPQEYFALFRGNIFASLDALCRDRADSDQVRKAFLARLRDEYNPAMVPGMIDVVRRLAGNCTLAVVSSNAMEVLRRVLVGNDVAYCFAHVFGGDTAPDKGAAIRSFLADTGSRYGRRCEVAYDETPAPVRPDPSTTVLVTDTAGDVRDALDTGIRAIGVAWGMHGTDELSEAGAEFVAIWPQELPGYLLGDEAPAPAGACAVPVADASRSPAGECACGCSAPAATPQASAATRQAAAAAIRRSRRQLAVQAVRHPADLPASLRAGQAAPGAGQAAPGAELREAVRRILQPAPER